MVSGIGANFVARFIVGSAKLPYLIGKGYDSLLLSMKHPLHCLILFRQYRRNRYQQLSQVVIRALPFGAIYQIDLHWHFSKDLFGMAFGTQLCCTAISRAKPWLISEILLIWSGWSKLAPTKWQTSSKAKYGDLYRSHGGGGSRFCQQVDRQF